MISAPAHVTRHSLIDGAEVLLRPLEPDDGDVVMQVFDGLGPTSRHRRFLAPKQRLTAEDLRRLTAVDHLHHEALVASSALEGTAVGIARFVRDAGDPSTAEVAIAVVDAWQGRGVGTLLARALHRRAGELGLRRFWVVMGHGNTAANRLLRRVVGAQPEVVAVDRGTIELSFPVSPVGRWSDNGPREGARR